MSDLNETFQNIADAIRKSNSEITDTMTPAQMSLAITNSASRVLYQQILSRTTPFHSGTGSGLTKIEAADLAGATCIGPNTFAGLELTSVVLPNSVRSIGSAAFYNCSSLTNITIPDSVTSIGDYAFDQCEKLATLHVGKASQQIKIGTSAFRNDTALKSVTITGNADISKYAFVNCTSLQTVTFIDGDTGAIGDSAFSECTALKSVSFDSSKITSIGTAAFWNSINISEVHLPASLTHLGNMAFATNDGRTGTFKVYCPALTPPVPDSDTPAWFSYGATRIIYVPTESVEVYKAALGWKYYADEIQAYDF